MSLVTGTWTRATWMPRMEAARTSSHSKHGYSVVEMNEDTVTLRNPWANNKKAGDDGFGHDADGDHKIKESDGENHGDRIEGTGVIRISRKDYEKFFETTEIGG